jgi:hypothetical protein
MGKRRNTLGRPHSGMSPSTSRRRRRRSGLHAFHCDCLAQARLSHQFPGRLVHFIVRHHIDTAAGTDIMFVQPFENAVFMKQVGAILGRYQHFALLVAVQADRTNVVVCFVVVIIFEITRDH